MLAGPYRPTIKIVCNKKPAYDDRCMIKNSSTIYRKLILSLTLLLFVNGLHAGTVTVHKNDVSGLLTWTSEDEGFSVELIQLLPDFIRAIYAKHNFPPDEIERAASYCMFGTILKNTSNQHLSYRVKNWRYKTEDGIELPVKTKSQWLDEWKKSGIIFSWTLLPDVGEFAVGDWQQGFTSIKLPRNKAFDLIYKWELDGVAHSGVIENLMCAPESLPTPAEK